MATYDINATTERTTATAPTVPVQALTVGAAPKTLDFNPYAEPPPNARFAWEIANRSWHQQGRSPYGGGGYGAGGGGGYVQPPPPPPKYYRAFGGGFGAGTTPFDYATQQAMAEAQMQQQAYKDMKAAQRRAAMDAAAAYNDQQVAGRYSGQILANPNLWNVG